MYPSAWNVKKLIPIGIVIYVYGMLVPMILYYLIVTFAGVDTYNWLLAVGFFGSMIFGVGASYTFAVTRKIYEKVWLPILCLLCGVIIIAVSLFFCF